MATDDTVLTDDSLTRRPDGLAIALKIPWYRSLWLSSVSGVTVAIDGKPATGLTAELNGRTYTIDELGEQSETLWFLQDRLVIRTPDDPGTDTVDVEVSVALRLPYMQIKPGLYVTNHATNRRVLEAR
ncbi:C-glycoside deglycosidase beta subunit domain-containing protein [Cryptosporangium japonicum]|uniref:C-deglycosylation enzyme beta subunit n=1 Tax=Cryptosporangium japonicum TaxID=80872 RepID=A0ABN0UF05_9ACTN